MTYAEFTAHLTTFLWKTNDTVLISSIDNLVAMADADLNRKLDINKREATVGLTTTTSSLTVPADFRHMVALNSDNCAYAYAPIARLIEARSGNSTNQEVPLYCTTSDSIELAQEYDAITPGVFYLTYRKNVPDFKTTDNSWLADEFLDLYTYAVLKHTAPFLREDERVQLWQGFYTDALTSVLEEDKFNIETGSPMSMRMARNASPIRRNGLYSR